MGNAVRLSSDPFNLIITGVGGQGNVLASRVVGNMLMGQGLYVTIGETFGASQRGGSVMSKAHMVVALEPTEALRVLRDYGNPDVKVICNMRPIHAVGVISGEMEYPAHEDLKKWIQALSTMAWFVNATDEAMKLGNPIFGNIMLVGALSATGMLPLDRKGFEKVISRIMPATKVEINLTAFDQGVGMINGAA
jgi:indolepyruvate ferredoxin oxidoreductase beta subunit